MEYTSRLGTVTYYDEILFRPCVCEPSILFILGLESIISDNENNPEQSILLREMAKTIRESMCTLTQREKELIEQKFFKDKKLREIADEYNISQSRISRIIQSGLDKIKRDLKRQGIL